MSQVVTTCNFFTCNFCNLVFEVSLLSIPVSTDLQLMFICAGFFSRTTVSVLLPLELQ